MAMECLQPVFAKCGEPWIDLFATFANRRLVKFVSPYPDPRAEWTDAMSMPWDVVPRVDGPLPRRSDPAVRRRSRPVDTRRLDGRQGDRQIYMRGNSPGHPESEESFQGSCQHDVKVPSGIFTSVWIPLVKIRGVKSSGMGLYMVEIFISWNRHLDHPRNSSTSPELKRL